MKEIVFTYIISYLIVVISCVFYTLLGFHNLDFFIEYYCSLFVICFYIVFSFYLYNKYRRNEDRLKVYNFFPFLYFGISLATFLNMIIFKFLPVQDNLSGTNDIFLLFSSGIIGPLLEEILFRFIFYNKLRNKYSVWSSIFISSFFFGIFHLTIIKIIYAFILGLFLSFIYEKEKKIFAAILVHIGANIFSFFLNEFNFWVFILSFVNLFISFYLVLDKQKSASSDKAN